MSRRLDLTSSEAKLGWAEDHLDELNRHIGTWTDGNGKRGFGLRYELKAHEKQIPVFTTYVRPVKPEWSLMVGDVLTNLAAALDHLAYQCVITGSKATTADLHNVYFPYWRTNRSDFLNKVGKKKLPGVSKRRLLMLSPFQPYERLRKQLILPHPLDALNKLVGLDKHRHLHLTTARPYGWGGSPGFFEKFSPVGELGTPLEPNTHICTFELRQPLPEGVSQEEVAMHAKVTANVVFEKSVPLVGNMAVVDSLEEIAAVVGEVLRKFGLPEAGRNRSQREAAHSAGSPRWWTLKDPSFPLQSPI
jgi:hypothetical protein